MKPDGPRAAVEEGFTLVECVISIAILGIAFAALLGGMATSATTSDFHRKEATANTLLVSSAEAVKDEIRNPFRNANCSTSAAYNPYTGITLPTPSWTITSAPVQYWNGTAFGATCFPAYRLQLVTLSVHSPDGRAVETVGVVKRAS